MQPREPQWKPEVTVTAVIEREGRFLLIEKYSRPGIRNNQPAGHLEHGKSLIKALIRETLEASAREFRPQALPGIYQYAHPGNGVTCLRLGFTGSPSETRPRCRPDAGIRRAQWMRLDEIRACGDRHRSPMLQRCVDDHPAGLRHPLRAMRHFNRTPA